MMQFLQENWFYISVSIAVISLIIVIMVRLIGIGVWVGTTNTQIESLQNGLKTVQEGLKTVQEGLKTVQEDIKKLFERLPPPKTADSSSPLNLTDFGQKISDHVDAKEWASNNVRNLMNQARDKEEFEIFAICSEYVEKTFNEDTEFNRKVQSVAYNYGTDIEQVLMVYRIELRDQVLANLDN